MLLLNTSYSPPIKYSTRNLSFQEPTITNDFDALSFEVSKDNPLDFERVFIKYRSEVVLPI